MFNRRMERGESGAYTQCYMLKVKKEWNPTINGITEESRGQYAK